MPLCCKPILAYYTMSQNVPPLAYYNFITATLRSRCGHYIFALWFLLSSTFFPRLISAVAEWMSTILVHMVWL